MSKRFLLNLQHAARKEIQRRKDIAEMIWRLLNRRRWIEHMLRTYPASMEATATNRIDTINRKIAILREAGR